jgi:hypothetical protein
MLPQIKGVNLEQTGDQYTLTALSHPSASYLNGPVAHNVPYFATALQFLQAIDTEIRKVFPNRSPPAPRPARHKCRLVAVRHDLSLYVQTR